jgi:hypothetical protein
MERIIYKHVYNHLIQDKLIYQYQSGFLPQQTQTHMRTTNLCLLLFGVYNINNVQTILINFLLFHNNSFYVNDIGDKLLSLSRLFADDTSLGYASQDEDQIKYVINHDLHELGDWSKRWLMSY